ncbi:MAG: hypothetical protein ACLFVU_14140 [Phycisphaerae bacterium]
MSNKPERLLKKDRVKLVQSPGRVVKSIPKAATGPSADARPKQPAQAKIITKGGGMALVEVTCPCGEKIMLECRLESA